jgi:CRISPR-associated endonuclease/helicase Cas3
LQGFLASLATSAREIAPDFTDLLDPAAIRRYFELHYWKHTDRWDHRDVMSCFPKPLSAMAFDFRQAAERFRMIEDTAKPVVVLYDRKAEDLIQQLRRDEPTRFLLRLLQRYTVSVYENVYRQMLGSDIEELPGETAVLINRDCYDRKLGFQADRQGYHDPESLFG